MGHFITLDLWVDDVVQVIVAEELADVILVGHSFGGRVVTGVVDRIPERIRQVVFLDAALPKSGKSLLDEIADAAGKDAVAKRVALTQSSDGTSLPAPSALALGVNDPSQQAWVERRLTPQPFGTNTSAITFRSPIGAGRPVSFIKFTDPTFPASVGAQAFAEAQKGWTISSIPTGHMAMVSAPAAVSRALLSIAAGSATTSELR